MNHFFQSLPKTVLAFGVIGISIFLIIASNPPHTLCDSQEEIFKQSQAGNIFPKPSENRKMLRQPKLAEYVKQCKMSNSPGGCYDAFSSMESLLDSIRMVPRECYQQVGQIAAVKSTLLGSLKLLAELAWGEAPPGEGTDRYGFLTSAELMTFCKMQVYVRDLYGEEFFTQYRLKVFSDYKGAQGLDKNEVWNRSIFSTRCNSYL